MLTAIVRRKDILNIIYKQGSVKVTLLAKKYDVNEATIRRDLKDLAKKHGIHLAYGGAFIDDGRTCDSIGEINLIKKRRHNFEEKQMIARKAAKLINDGETIALNAGSTAEYILDYLENITHLNVITLCAHIAIKAATNPAISLYMPGGRLRSPSGVFYGDDSVDFLKKFSVDKCFLGIAAVNIKKGIMHPVLEEIPNQRILLDISEKKYLIADYSKFDCASLATMADLEEFDGLIVDDKLPEVYHEFAKLNNIEII